MGKQAGEVRVDWRVMKGQSHPGERFLAEMIAVIPWPRLSG